MKSFYKQVKWIQKFQRPFINDIIKKQGRLQNKQTEIPGLIWGEK